MIGSVQPAHRNIVVRDTPAGSATRGGLAAAIAYGITLIAANNGVPLPPEVAAAIGGAIAGGLSALIRILPWARA
jgi:hypothetical protein